MGIAKKAMNIGIDATGGYFLIDNGMALITRVSREARKQFGGKDLDEIGVGDAIAFVADSIEEINGHRDEVYKAGFGGVLLGFHRPVRANINRALRGNPPKVQYISAKTGRRVKKPKKA